jgi:hypothetical protein
MGAENNSGANEPRERPIPRAIFVPGSRYNLTVEKYI